MTDTKTMWIFFCRENETEKKFFKLNLFECATRIIVPRYEPCTPSQDGGFDFYLIFFLNSIDEKLLH